MNRCGQCKQFTRAKALSIDLCGAWQQPTLAARIACEYFMPKKRHRNAELNKADNKA